MTRSEIYALLAAAMISLTGAVSSSAEPGNGDLKLSFTYYGVFDGLPSNEINRITQDSLGFIWCATNNGLVRFDGYEFSEFRSSYKHPSFFPNNYVRDMERLGSGKMCLVLSDQAAIFDKTESRTEVINDTVISSLKLKAFVPVTKTVFILGGEDGGVIYDSETGAVSDRISCNGEPVRHIRQIYRDSEGNIWLGTWRRGIYLMRAGSDTFVKIKRKGLPGNITVTKFVEDKDGNLFVGTWGDGLFCLSGKKRVLSYSWPKSDADHLDRNIIYDIAVDDKGMIWTGTPGGLRIFSLAGGRFSTVSYVNAETRREEDLHEVRAVFKDNDGNIWLSDYGKGLVTISHEMPGIREIDPRDMGVNYSVVTALYKQGDILWIGIRGLNFIRYDMRAEKILPDAGFMRQFDPECNAVVSFVPVPEKDLLFLSTRYHGVYMLKMNAGEVTDIRYFDTGVPGIRNEFTNTAARDTENNIWVGTNSGLSILRCSPDGGYEVMNPAELNSYLKNCVVETVFPDSKGNVWVGTTNSGLYRIRYDADTGTIEEFRRYCVENGTVSNNKIQTIFEDSKGRLWTGTNGGGLNVYRSGEDTFEIIRSMDLFPSDQIFALAEDESGKLWISTGKGVTCYDPDARGGSLWNIGIDVGLKNLSFIKNAVLEEAGTIVFGGYDGLSIFTPDMISQEGEVPGPSIIDVQILNESLFTLPEKERIRAAAKLPPYSERIVLGHKDISVSFKYVSPTFRNEELVKYAYRLSGLEKGWNYVKSDQRTVTYNYLKPGNYVFEVKAGNAADMWNPVTASVDVVVRPAPWLTVWAKLGYLIVSLLAGYGVFVTVRNRARLRQALRIEQMERLKSDEVNNAKLMFFTNVSHELFTPITVMSCSLEKLIEKEPENLALHKIMRSNLNRLMRLLQQIMEFRKAESSNLKLRVSEIDIVPFLKKICDENFSPLVVDRNIRMIFSSASEHIKGYADTDKLDKIVYNLISNAYKYNRDDGKVFVSVGEETDNGCRFVVISVKDTGYGIEKDRLKDLFKRFYEGDYRKFNTKGTGIGLSLTKDLVDLHRGTIKVDSTEGEGTVFTVRLPLDKDAYSPDQIDSGIIAQSDTYSPGHAERAKEAHDENTPTLMIVEDNEDLRLVMKNILEPTYRIFTASNGRLALDILKDEDVDLVITDYLMPEMDGIELCRAIRSDITISHLPVIMLSAKTEKESKLKSFESGVDAYVTKPFEVNLLVAQVDGMIANRRKLYDKFRSEENMPPDLLISTDMDKRFIDKAIRLIESHISDADYNIDVFNDEMNMSYSTLYRKIKGVTGMSPKEFIRNIRFKYACRLLLEKTATVSEVAFMVGFTDAKYFSISFKKEFGMTPSQYIAEHRKKNE